VKAKRILVVEDDDDIRTMIELTLVGEGHEVIATADGAEALELLGRTSVDAVVLDLKMPMMSGVEFARRYREMGATAPIILLSAAQHEDEIAREIGTDHSLAKPFEIEDLIDAVESATR
jgi:DNA-binding response OmpR family regulator